MFLYFISAITITLFCACEPVNYQQAVPPQPVTTTQHNTLPEYRQPQQYLTTPGRGFYHTVKYNETLWQISKKYNIPAQTIADLNNLPPSHHIRPGQSLLIPKSPYAENLQTVSHGTFMWPVKGRVVGQFGIDINGVANDGLNIETSSAEVVKAAEDGQIVFADYLKGWGQTIIVEHPNNYYTVYANLKNITTRMGERVQKGAPLAQVALNNSNDIILHFEIRKNNVSINPLRYLQ